MYRILNMNGKNVAVELYTAGRSAKDELDEIQDWLENGYSSKIIDDDEFQDLIDNGEVELVEREWL